MIYVVDAKYISEYKIDVVFSDGTSKVVDLKEDIFSDKREKMQQLRDINYFKQVEYNEEVASIAWDNGVDFEPSYLYNR